jgi:hypothetical protein
MRNLAFSENISQSRFVRIPIKLAFHPGNSGRDGNLPICTQNEGDDPELCSNGKSRIIACLLMFSTGYASFGHHRQLDKYCGL